MNNYFENIMVFIVGASIGASALIIFINKQNKKRAKLNAHKSDICFVYERGVQSHSFNLLVDLEPNDVLLVNSFINRILAYEEIQNAREFFNYHLAFSIEKGNSTEFYDQLNYKLRERITSEKEPKNIIRLQIFLSVVENAIAQQKQEDFGNIHVEKSKNKIALFKLLFTFSEPKYGIGGTHEALARLLYCFADFKKAKSAFALRKQISECRIEDYISDDQREVIAYILKGEKLTIEQMFPKRFKG